MATPKPWVINITGDLESPISVKIDPTKENLSNLKEKLKALLPIDEQTLFPIDEQTLYYDKRPLLDTNTPLIDYEGLTDNAHLLLRKKTWDLKINGDVSRAIEVKIDAHRSTVKDLQQKVQEQLSQQKERVSEYTLYCGMTKVEHYDEKRLHHYSFLKTNTSLRLKKTWVLNINGDANCEVGIKHSETCTVNQLKGKIKEQTGIHVNEQTLYYNNNELIHNDQNDIRDYQDMQNETTLHLKRSWVLVICGDIRNSIPVIIKDPEMCKVNDLKKKIQAETNIPVSEQTLFYGEIQLEHSDTKHLHQYGLKSGIAVCVKTSDLVITAKCTDNDREIKVLIPRSHLESWTVKKIRECICQKFWYPVESKHYLISGATVLEETKDQRKITEYLQKIDGVYIDSTLTFTPLEKVSMKPWVININGDLDSPITVNIEDPMREKLPNLKEKLTTYVPLNEQVLYCDNTPLTDTGTPLHDYEAFKNNVHITLRNKIWTLEIYGDVNSPFQVKIDAERSTMNDLKQKVQQTISEQQERDSEYTLYYGMTKLEHNDEKYLHHYTFLKNNASLRLNKNWMLNINGEANCKVEIKHSETCTVDQLKGKIKEKTGIHFNEQTLYYSNIELMHDDQKDIRDYQDMQNETTLHLKRSWVLVICGDINDPTSIKVKDPKSCTIDHLKKKIQEKMEIPFSEQILYWGEKVLEHSDTEHLEDKGLSSGIAICIKRSNIVITANRTDYDANVTVSIPRSQVESWTVRKIRQSICHKFGFPVECKHYLVSGGTVLEDDNQKIIEYLSKKDDGSYEDSTLIFTPLKTVSMATPEKSTGKPMYVPAALSASDLMTKIYTDQPLSTDTKDIQIDAWKGTWNLKIRVSKNKEPTDEWPTDPQAAIFKVQVPECELTPIFRLREIIEINEKCNIPVNKQELSIKGILLHDWDNEGRPKLLRNYPVIHDGATINLTDVSESKTVKVKQPTSSTLTPSKSDLIFSVLSVDQVDPPSSIVIYPSDKMTLETLAKVVSNCEETSSDILYIQKRSIFGSGVSEVKSMADIKDGCCVTTTQQ